MKHFVTFLVFLMFVLCGFSKQMTSPAELSQQITKADHMIVTNHYRAVGQSISGEEVGNLVKSIASARKKTWGSALDWTSERVCNVSFYTGTNSLVTIPFCYGIFKLEDVEYADSTGALETIWKKLDEPGR